MRQTLSPAKRLIRLAKPAICSLLALTCPPAHAAGEGQRVTVTGEFVDTWCYFSGVMGSPDAVVGTSHHTCAMWCSAGGVPVGLKTPDGQVYMILKIEGDDGTNSGDTQLSLASDTVTADGMLYKRDGLNYIVVSKVVSNEGITNQTHKDYGAVPDFAVPEPKQ